MNKIILGITTFLLGIVVTQIPDLVSLYSDHVIGKYQKKYCTDKNIGPDQCSFDVYYTPYEKDHPTLTRIHYYFLLGEGPLAYTLSGRCSNRIFHNPSAAPKDTGKITNRDYFFSHCSQFEIDISDIIFRKKP